MADGGVPGVEDVVRLGGWLADNGVPAGDGPPAVQLVGGGRSNLTYRLDVGPGRAPLILRRPPLGHVLPTAHDMAREYRVLTALNGTAVPVPRPVALCQDPSVVGAPFYLMDYVDGAVLRTSEDAGALGPGQAGLLSQCFVEMLARIHELDVDSVGLAGFGKPEGYLDRQLARWQRQWELSVTREMPGYDDLTRRLAAGLPAVTAAAPPGGLVHGDYRPRLRDQGAADRPVRRDHRPGPVPDRLLHGVRLLQAGGGPGGHPRPVPAAEDGGRGVRA